MPLVSVVQTVAWCFHDMDDDARIVITGVGFCTGLGSDPVASIARGETAICESEDLNELPHRLAARVDRIDLKAWLKRRKDRKLMARPSQLALAAAGLALNNWGGDTDSLGLFVGVGREPGDDGESEPSLVAAQVDGLLDEASVAGACRDLYPPLLPLKTLPNMALAHVSIHLDVRGDNGTWCGGASAGLMALRAAIWSIREGRSVGALVLAADSWVSAGCVRDLLRMSKGGPIDSPGEAGVALLVESVASAKARGADILADVDVHRGTEMPRSRTHHPHLGDCKAADALLALALRVGHGSDREIFAAEETGQPRVAVSLGHDESVACYADERKGINNV